MMRYLGWLLGLDNVSGIDEVDFSLAAAWAQDGSFLVFALAVGLVILSFFFYLRFQGQGSRAAHMGLAVCRGLLLALLIITLADPVLRLTVTNQQKASLYVIFDGTDSMAIEDELAPAQREALDKAVGLEASKTNGNLSRAGYVQSLVKKPEDNLLVRLQKEKNLDIEAYVFDGNTTSQLRKLSLSGNGSESVDPAHLAQQLTTTGQVTALGSVMSEASQQLGSGRLAGVLLFSDFAHNSGLAPLGGGENSPASRLGVPVYTVGVGATEATDVSVDLQVDPKMKKAERSVVTVKLRQSGLQGQPVNVHLTARKLGGETAESEPLILVGQRQVTLQTNSEAIDFPFTPDEAGKFEFAVQVDKVEGEVVDQNNRAIREVNIIDDYLRLMYVAYEPTWEWRFVKEVFHRDKLVGMQGFRTFLNSSDPSVREGNILFLPTLTPKRSDFFANDVLFIDDMPRASLTDRFGDMLKEYVGNLGGGLVVIAGPRFGPKEMVQTPLADMLPVIVDPNAEMRTAPNSPEFKPRLTVHAARYPYMQLGESSAENQKAWDNFGKLPWYQPVAALHEQAYALAEHPTEKCADGKTPQPIIAVRTYGKGQVVYIAHNEMWRLRRRYGEKYYRQFWSQLIYNLGMSHALGAEKRFVTRLDQQQYRAEDKVTLSVEAFDENYEPLVEEKLPAGGLAAELIVPTAGGTDTRALTVPMLSKGRFEIKIPVVAAGEYGLRVKDPVTGKFSEERFEVLPLSAERRRAIRDEELQSKIATQTRGKSYDLTTVNNLTKDLQVQTIVERMTRNRPLWSTPLWFGLVVALMLGEWFSRKMVKLS
ncbi:MAG: hypothetical protein ACO1RA_10790 [Planctomycetaceae bacterium]